MSGLEEQIIKLKLPGIKILDIRNHAKASEKYIDVTFTYGDDEWNGSVPIEYRRTGTNAKTIEDVIKILMCAYDNMKPETKTGWVVQEDEVWANRRADVTSTFYHTLKDSKWKCQTHDLPMNPNWARRVQDLKEMGYTISTHRRYCNVCKKTTTHLILLRVPRTRETGYETINPHLKTKIIKTLARIDAYENERRSHLLPDHKFPEIRWDENTRSNNPEDMDGEDIKKKFQLLNNQRNEQKREVCRNCYQTGKRGKLFGISYYYQGDENWPSGIPTNGDRAEQGCVGCGWYDIQRWRDALIKKISK